MTRTKHKTQQVYRIELMVTANSQLTPTSIPWANTQFCYCNYQAGRAQGLTRVVPALGKARREERLSPRDGGDTEPRSHTPLHSSLRGTATPCLKKNVMKLSITNAILCRVLKNKDSIHKCTNFINPIYCQSKL